MAIVDIRRAALRSLIPPPRLQLSEWIEANIRLPDGVWALPGVVRWPHQREIAANAYQSIARHPLDRAVVTRV